MSKSISVSDININDVINCTMYGHTGLANISGGVVVGIIHGTNLLLPLVAVTHHANIYPTIPVGSNVVNDYTAYNYLVVKLPSGYVIEVGIPWINPISVERVERSIATVTIKDFDNTREDELKALLISRGWTDIIVGLN